jgi:cobalt/nickel transport system permease protein
MLTFLYRFTDVFVEQLASMRRAVASRAPALGPWGHVRLYGNLAGNLFIRSYERGERVYAAMLSRGYSGVLPSAEALASRPADWLAIATVLLVVAAVLLY